MQNPDAMNRAVDCHSPKLTGESLAKQAIPVTA